MHVGHDVPRVLEGDLLAWLKESVDVFGLAIVASNTQGVSESLP